MKKIFVMLVALIGFGISTNAQTFSVTNVKTTHSRDGKTVDIEVTVTARVTEQTGYHCYLDIKVCPKTRNVLDALFINCEYGTICIPGGLIGETTVKFSCSVKENAVAPRCGAYDFDVTLTSDPCKKK